MKGKSYQKGDTLFYVPADYHGAMFKEFHSIGTFHQKDYTFEFDDSNRVRALQAISFYESEATNLTKGQRNLIQKITKTCCNLDLFFMRRDGFLHMVDVHGLSGTNDQVKADLAKLGLVDVVVVNNVRFRIKLNIEIPENLKKANEQIKKIATMTTRFDNERDADAQKVQLLVNKVLEFGTEIVPMKKDEVNITFKSPDHSSSLITVNWCASYIRISYWRRSKYVNKIQVSYNKEYKESEIIDRLKNLLK